MRKHGQGGDKGPVLSNEISQASLSFATFTKNLSTYFLSLSTFQMRHSMSYLVSCRMSAKKLLM